MCGIAGLVLNDTACRPDETLVARMVHALHHRGPDDVGGYLQPGIALGMRRLAVMDVAGGRQPVMNETGTVVAVFNGEIYNFPALRQQLIDRGHRLDSQADSEVIVHLYEEFGADFVRHLNGMFAIALWDVRKQSLILVRDRLGVKPLYYAHLADRLVFGSEIKAVLQDPAVPRDVNPDGLNQLLTFGHFQAPSTCWQAIHELPPATLLTYCGGQITTHAYWDLEFPAAAQTRSPNMDDSLQMLRGAVADRLLSDVPLGAFLSGGIDSSLIVALMSQQGVTQLKTFSIGFQDENFSELPAAREVSQRFRTEHHEFIVRPDVRQILPQLIAHHDSPFYDTSAIPTFHLCRLAREHVTVALSGDGGDELFAGYNIFLANKAAGYWQRLPAWLRHRLLVPLANCIPETSQYINKGRVAREFVRAASLETLARYTRWATKVKRETREALYAEGMRSQLAAPDTKWWTAIFQHPHAGETELQRLLYLASKTELPGDMLVKVDRMSMAHGLEVRSPLLDYRLFEWAAQCRDQDKLRGRITKYHLRQIAKQLLPRSVVDRPKRGFSIPLDRWLRTDLGKDVREILLDPVSQARGLFVPAAVERLIAEHASGQIARGRELWTLMTIELWHRMYVDELQCWSAQPSAIAWRRVADPSTRFPA